MPDKAGPILLLGGYGGFGAVIAEELARDGHRVLVAGRSLAKAVAFCAGRDGLTPLACDRAAVADAIAAHKPWLVIDASGPFQAMDHAVPRACIIAGVAYCDIADGSDFVCGIGALDADAKAAGVPIIAGVSSVPALSGAVVRALAEGMTRVVSVEMAISASNRASAGPAVVAAVLGQIGQPFVRPNGDSADRLYGWQSARRLTFRVAGARPLRGRSVFLVDVPDVHLLPGRLSGAPKVTFRAGTELGFQNWALWALSWLVRARIIGSLGPWASALLPLQKLTQRWGGERSAMVVRLAGEDAGGAVERQWTLIADQGHGPRIPALSVPALVRRMVAGTVEPGARDGGAALDLTDYDEAFSRIAVRHGVEERRG